MPLVRVVRRVPVRRCPWRDSAPRSAPRSFLAAMLPRLSSRESGLGLVGQRQQVVGDGGVALDAQALDLLLQPAHLSSQECVLLGYAELRGCDDVTEQGLGHDCNGLSAGERDEPGAPW